MTLPVLHAAAADFNKQVIFDSFRYAKEIFISSFLFFIRLATKVTEHTESFTVFNFHAVL